MRILFGQYRCIAPDLLGMGLSDKPADAASRVATYAFAQELLHANDWWDGLWQQRNLLDQKLGLIFWGMKDSFVPAYELDKWVAAFPNARVIKCPDAGHFVQEEAGALMVQELAQYF